MAKKTDMQNLKPETRNSKPATSLPATLPCARCGSAKRSEGKVIAEQAFGGVTKDGKPFTHIVRAVSLCVGCGQSRIVTTYENRNQVACEEP